MATPVIVPVASYITLAQISQFLAADDIARGLQFSGSSPVDPELPRKLYLVRTSLQWAYAQNPNDPSLNAVALFLYSLCGRYINAAETLLSNQMILLPLTLDAMAVSTTEIDLTWTAVPNATNYVLERALDSGFTVSLTTVFNGSALAYNNTGLTAATQYFYRIHAEAAGFTNSPYAYANATTQSVVVPITVAWWYGPSDPYPALSGGTDSLSYEGTLNIVHNAPIVVPFPLAASDNQYLVVRVPVGESIKTTWQNTVLNSGQIPDQAWQSPLQSPPGPAGFVYYVTRTSISIDSTQPVTLS